MKNLLLLLSVSVLLVSPAFSRQLEESVVVEIHNNCGKKIELSVELINNSLHTSMENGIKSKFRLRKETAIKVNKSAVYTLKAEDDGKVIKLCK